MAEPYTPTTEEVRERFIDGFPMDTWIVSREQCGQDFDVWLAAHDAQVLRDAALSGDLGTTAQSTLLRRADRIEGGTSGADWDRVHNRPADIYTPPEDRIAGGTSDA